MYKKILIVISIALLVLGNIYFYNKTENLDYAITIGVPTGNDYSTMGIDYYEPLTDKDKDEANLLIFSLMDGVSIDKPKVCEELPNVAIMFSDWKNNISYYKVYLWINGNDVVIASDEFQPKYKIIDDSRAIEIKKIIEKYKVKTYK